ncbi:MAG: 30S ribosomal protein S20 [Bacilli bacterium]|nr:30S ribosomal protein S20 [Bacilli bacterium]
MPNIKSAKKRVKTDAVKKDRNREKVAAMRTAIKNVKLAAKNGDKKLAEEQLSLANKKIDKAVKHGLIKKNKAARDKSKLNKAINSIK